MPPTLPVVVSDRRDPDGRSTVDRAGGTASRRAWGSLEPQMRYLLLMLSLAALLMTGCIRQELSITVAADGSGSLTQLLTISDAFSETTGESPAGIFDDGIFRRRRCAARHHHGGGQRGRLQRLQGLGPIRLALRATRTGRQPHRHRPGTVHRLRTRGDRLRLVRPTSCSARFEDPAAAAAPPSGEAAAATRSDTG